VDWDKYLSGTDDDCWQSFKTMLQSLEDKYILLCNVRKKKKPIWMTHSALKCLKKKNKVCSKFKDKSHPAVKRANLKAKIELTKARRLFENKLAANIKSDKKSFYEYTRSKSKVMVQMSSVLNKHGQKLSDD